MLLDLKNDQTNQRDSEDITKGEMLLCENQPKNINEDVYTNFAN